MDLEQAIKHLQKRLGLANEGKKITLSLDDRAAISVLCIAAIEHGLAGRRGETFRTLKEVKEKYFPNRSLEDLEGRKNEGILVILPRC